MTLNIGLSTNAVDLGLSDLEAVSDGDFPPGLPQSSTPSCRALRYDRPPDRTRPTATLRNRKAESGIVRSDQRFGTNPLQLLSAGERIHLSLCSWTDNNLLPPCLFGAQSRSLSVGNERLSGRTAVPAGDQRVGGVVSVQSKNQPPTGRNACSDHEDLSVRIRR